MEKLEITHLAGYLGHRLRIYYKFPVFDGKKERHVVELSGLNVVDTILHGYRFKPLLLPMKAITSDQWIEVFKAGLIDHNPKYAMVVYILDDGVELCLDEGNGFETAVDYCFHERAFNSKGFKFDQWAAFNQLARIHADYHLLIPKRFALDERRFI